ncbi:MAG: hypothetical protein ACC660_08870, partial [Acidimicrobiales bacterium]
MSAPSAQVTPSPVWLRSRGFDAMFVFGTAGLALVSGLVVVARPSLFGFLLFLDLWLLGYHHIFATMTRVGSDRRAVQEHRFLMTRLPFLVALGVWALLSIGEGAALAGVYFYWQWLHYTRQSYGVERMYWRKMHGGDAPRIDRLTWSAIYVLPFAGLLYRSVQGQDEFLGGKSLWIPVPRDLMLAVAAVAAVLTCAWLVREAAMSIRSRSISPHSLYVISHIVVFAVGYGLIKNVTHGWLVINMWHNAQYVMVVWMYNRGRFKSGVDPDHRLVSKLSQPGRAIQYFAISIGLSTVVYLFLGLGTALVAGTTVPALVYMSINFHHYIVDSFIWKTRKPQHQKN